MSRVYLLGILAFTLPSQPAGAEKAEGVSKRFIRSFPLNDRKVGDPVKSWTRLLKFNSEGDRLLVVDNEGTVNQWNPLDGKLLSTFKLSDPPYAYWFDRNGWMLFQKNASLKDATGEIEVWDLKTAKKLPSLRSDPPRMLLRGFFTLDGSRMVSYEYEYKTEKRGIYIWDIEKRSSRRLGDAAQGFALAPDGKSMVMFEEISKTQSRMVRINLGTGEREATKDLPDYHTTDSPRFSPDGRHIAVPLDGRKDNIEVLELYNAETLERLSRLTGPVATDGHARYREFVFSPGGQRLATLSATNTLTVWGLGHMKCLYQHTFKESQDPRLLEFSPDNKKLAVLVESKDGEGKWNCRLFLFDIASKTELEEIICPAGVRGSGASGVFSPDGKLFAIGGYSAAHLFDMTDKGQEK